MKILVFSKFRMLLVCLLITSMEALAVGVLSPNQLIKSEHLNYSLQYRVYTPEGFQQDQLLPTFYLTDGQWYIAQGNMIVVLDQEIEQGTIKPIVVVFVDSRDPENLLINRRKEEFFGKQEYIEFFKNELVPLITADYSVSPERTNRVIGGVSFGGMNAAVFGLKAFDTFYGIAMQSPANNFHLRAIRKMYKEQEPLPIKLYFSVGTKGTENISDSRKFKRVLEKKGYDMNYIEVPFGHTWENWQPLVDDMLRTFFSE